MWVLLWTCGNAVDPFGWNRSRQPGTRRIEKARSVEVRHRPLPPPEAVRVERRAAFPGGLQPGRGIGQPGCADLAIQRDHRVNQCVGAGKVRRENQAPKPDTVARRRILGTDGDVMGGDRQHSHVEFGHMPRQPGFHICTVHDQAGANSLGDPIADDLTHRWLPRAAGPEDRRTALHQPSRQVVPLPPLRIPRARPAERCVQIVFECLPTLPACRARRVRIEGPQNPIRSTDPSGDDDIELKISNMGMRRDENWRAAVRGYARAGDLRIETQDRVHMTARFWLPVVEFSDIDILITERNDQRCVSVLSRRNSDSRSHHGRVTDKNFRRRVAPNQLRSFFARLDHILVDTISDAIDTEPCTVSGVFRGEDHHSSEPSAEIRVQSTAAGTRIARRNCLSIISKCANIRTVSALGAVAAISCAMTSRKV